MFLYRPAFLSVGKPESVKKNKKNTKGTEDPAVVMELIATGCLSSGLGPIALRHRISPALPKYLL